MPFQMGSWAAGELVYGHAKPWIFMISQLNMNVDI